MEKMCGKQFSVKLEAITEKETKYPRDLCRRPLGPDSGRNERGRSPEQNRGSDGRSGGGNTGGGGRDGKRLRRDPSPPPSRPRRSGRR